MGLAVVRDLREVRAPACGEEIERFETDVVAGFVLARAAAGLSDSTIRGDVSHLSDLPGSKQKTARADRQAVIVAAIIQSR